MKNFQVRYGQYDIISPTDTFPPEITIKSCNLGNLVSQNVLESIINPHNLS